MTAMNLVVFNTCQILWIFYIMVLISEASPGEDLHCDQICGNVSVVAKIGKCMCDAAILGRSKRTEDTESNGETNCNTICSIARTTGVNQVGNCLCSSALFDRRKREIPTESNRGTNCDTICSIARPTGVNQVGNCLCDSALFNRRKREIPTQRNGETNCDTICEISGLSQVGNCMCRAVLDGRRKSEKDMEQTSYQTCHEFCKNTNAPRIGNCICDYIMFSSSGKRFLQSPLSAERDNYVDLMNRYSDVDDASERRAVLSDVLQYLIASEQRK